MRPYVVYVSKRSEQTAISSVLTFLFKKRGELQIPEYVQGLPQLKEYADDPSAVKLLICDVTVDGILPVIEAIRGRNADLRLVLLADQTVPPVVYIRPTILPTALLWRPLQPEATAKTLWEVMRTIPKDEAPIESKTTTGEAFCIDVRGDARRIPYDNISFFEARDKRLYLHTGRKEMPFTGTLEKLMEELPDGFIRVHKSFIINLNAVAEVHFGQNTVVLEGNTGIPISRSYKSALKAVFS